MSDFTAQNDNERYISQFYDESRRNNTFAVLKLAVNKENPRLVQLYQEHVANHNAKIRNSVFPDAGFDLFVPSTSYFEHPFETQFLNLEVKAEMIYARTISSPKTSTFVEVNHTGYYVYPRSSISKTPLMLANQTGIIDSGYRGNLIAAVRYLTTGPIDNNNPNIYELAENTRLFQICHPELLPIFVVLVDESELSTTVRGSGGFGSTGTRGVIHT
jgi:dUTP pyrophosphatase